MDEARRALHRLMTLDASDLFSMCRIMPSMTPAVSLFAALSAAVTLMAGSATWTDPVTCRTFCARMLTVRHGRPSLSALLPFVLRPLVADVFRSSCARSRWGWSAEYALVHAGVGKIDDGLCRRRPCSYLIQPRFFGIAYRAGSGARSVMPGTGPSWPTPAHPRGQGCSPGSLKVHGEGTRHLVFQIDECVGGEPFPAQSRRNWLRPNVLVRDWREPL